jgi:hypothetical protein
MWRQVLDDEAFSLRLPRLFWVLLAGGGIFSMALAAVTKHRRRSCEDAADLADMVSYLQEHLGSGVTAYVGGAEYPDMVKKWLDGTAQIESAHGSRLRQAYGAARCVVEAFGDETAVQWFFGKNPTLEDTAPAYVLRHGSPVQWEVVVPAALEFAETAR